MAARAGTVPAPASSIINTIQNTMYNTFVLPLVHVNSTTLSLTSQLILLLISRSYTNTKIYKTTTIICVKNTMIIVSIIITLYIITITITS
jgi:hypothetical protein